MGTLYLNLGGILSATDVARQSAVTPTGTEATKSKAAKAPMPLWWKIGLGLTLIVIALTAIPGFWETGRVAGSDIHSPGMGDFFPETMIWDGTAFQFNRLTLARLIVAVVLCLIMAITSSRLRLIPTRGQSVIEFIAEFVRKNIGIELLGTAKGKRYATALGIIFFGVLGMNLTGILPGINIAASSVMSVPLIFAVFAYGTFIAAGISARGGWKFFREQLFPPGVPWPVYLLLTPIELFSVFVVRPATLAIRLLSNMIAGHMLLAITYFGTQAMVVAAAPMKPLAILTLSGSIVLTLFELFVAVLQAYVFTILTAVYIKMSVEAH